MDDSDVRYLLEVDVWYPGNKLQEPYNNLSLKKLLANFYDNKYHFIHQKVKKSIKSWISI